jgi:hypothetical protein
LHKIKNFEERFEAAEKLKEEYKSKLRKWLESLLG